MERSGSVVLNQLMRAIPKRGRASGESSVVAERFRKLHFEKFPWTTNYTRCKIFVSIIWEPLQDLLRMEDRSLSQTRRFVPVEENVHVLHSLSSCAFHKVV